MTDPSAFAPAGPLPAGPVPGVITLARHGEPALSRKIKLDARAYDRWWATYEAGGILPGQTAPPALLETARQADVIFTSIRRRAIETAESVSGGASFAVDPMFVEAPLPSPRTPAWLRLGPKSWGVLNRALWWLGHSAGRETRPEAKARAVVAAERLIAEADQGRNVLVVAHGFFNSMVGVELTRRGWPCVYDGGFKYWAQRRFERR
jgi:broad specificity phosphatase PhoE